MKKNCSFLPLIRFEGCERPERDIDSCSLLARNETLKPRDQFVAKSVSLSHCPAEGPLSVPPDKGQSEVVKGDPGLKNDQMQRAEIRLNKN